MIFAYLGPGEPPLLPAYDFLNAPDACFFVSKYYHECNYLQSNEGNIDPSHLSYLHHFLKEDPSPLAPGAFKTPEGGNISSNSLFGRDQSPRLEVEETDYGVRIFAIRNAGESQKYVRITNFLYPNGFRIPMQGGWHVPIDDTHHWKFQLMFSGRQLDKARLRQDLLAEMTPDYHHRRNRANRYLQGRDEMRTRSIAGMGPFFQNHDKWATEGPGPIQDRTQEHLAYTDKAIVLARQLLLRAVRQVLQGGDAPHVVREAERNRFPHLVSIQEVVPDLVDWRTHWTRPEVAAAR